jgi:hypothetical protein
MAFLALSMVVSAEQTLGAWAGIGVPMSCAAFAHIRGAEFPKTMRVYDEGHTPRSITEAHRAALGLGWQDRVEFAETSASVAFNELRGRLPTEAEMNDERSR